MATRQARHARPRQTARILIVDDHPIVREGLSLVIGQQSDLEVCGEAGGTAEALKKYRQLKPELAIIDISLADGSGLELIKELTAIDPNFKSLVVSMHDESLFAERALRAGARGYISKAEPIEKIVEAIRQVLAGKVYLSEQMTDRILRRTVGNGEPLQHSPLESLSDRELDVFQQIGQGFTTRQIADKLHLSPKTVETYREHIKAKLRLSNAAELTQHAVRWVLENS